MGYHTNKARRNGGLNLPCTANEAKLAHYASCAATPGTIQTSATSIYVLNACTLVVKCGS
eukprot:scaffold59541_cov31-Prasinocladus_malaysianus.AAC.2